MPHTLLYRTIHEQNVTKLLSNINNDNLYHTFVLTYGSVFCSWFRYQSQYIKSPLFSHWTGWSHHTRFWSTCTHKKKFRNSPFRPFSNHTVVSGVNNIRNNHISRLIDYVLRNHTSLSQNKTIFVFKSMRQ